MSVSNLFQSNHLPLIYLNNDTGGVKYTGDITATGASGAITFNKRMGHIIFTGVASIPSEDEATLTINNSLMTGNPFVRGSVTQQIVAAGSAVFLKTIFGGSGLLSFTVFNPTSTATGASGQIIVEFEIVN